MRNYWREKLLLPNSIQYGIIAFILGLAQ